MADTLCCILSNTAVRKNGTILIKGLPRLADKPFSQFIRFTLRLAFNRRTFWTMRTIRTKSAKILYQPEIRREGRERERDVVLTAFVGKSPSRASSPFHLPPKRVA